MEEFYLKVYLFKPNRVPPIKIAKDSQLKITIETMDYTIPGGATASAFATGVTSEKVYTQSCTVSGNKVSFTPVPGFFVQGRNLLQYEIGGGVIPLSIDVNCEISLPTTGETAEPETVRPLVQRAEAAAATAEEKANAAAGSAGSAAVSADAAGKSAADALGSKNAAAGSASAAAGSAASAGQSANSAAGSASDALQSKNAAAGSAQEALTSKNAAANSADSAAGSASSAAGSANAAAGSAQEALASQNAAAGSAQAAQDYLQKTQEISVNPAYIGDNGNWFVWDTGQDSYVDSGVKAQGPKGEPGAVQTVCGVAPDASGNVLLNAGNVGAATNGYVDASVRKAAPRNLLDNSDFTNMVAQAGIGGNHGTVAYAADRWILDSGTVSYAASVGLTLNGTIRQKLENAQAVAYPYVGMVSGTASINYSNGIVTITSGGGVIKWAALYEGAYTAETLPEYNPKGYAAELAECKRYFVKYEDVRLIPFVFDGMTLRHYRLNHDIPMRVEYPTIDASGLVEIKVWGDIASQFNFYGSDKNGVTFSATGEVSDNSSIYVAGTIAFDADL